jgi:hypothetical protein
VTGYSPQTLQMPVSIVEVGLPLRHGRGVANACVQEIVSAPFSDYLGENDMPSLDPNVHTATQAEELDHSGMDS